MSKITEKHYKDTEIQFKPGSHRYKVVKKGEEPYSPLSVTRVTGIVDKSTPLMFWASKEALNWFKEKFAEEEMIEMAQPELMALIEKGVYAWRRKRDKAANIGTQVHKWVEEFGQAKIEDNEVPDVPDEPEEVINGISAFLDWYNQRKIKFLATEKIVYSARNDYVGIADAITEVDDKKILLDYKTSSGIYPEHFYQVSAYRMAYEEEFGPLDGHRIINFNKKDGSLKVKVSYKKQYERDKKAFLNCLELTRVNNALKEALKK